MGKCSDCKDEIVADSQGSYPDRHVKLNGGLSLCWECYGEHIVGSMDDTFAARYE